MSRLKCYSYVEAKYAQTIHFENKCILLDGCLCAYRLQFTIPWSKLSSG